MISNYKSVNNRFYSIFTYAKSTSSGLMRSMALMLLLTFIGSLNSNAQCTSPTPYQGAAAPAAGASTTLTTCAFAGEFSI